MQPTEEKQRFIVTDRLSIQDSDFVHDACLMITGDFASMEDKQSYVQTLVDSLNGYEELKQQRDELLAALKYYEHAECKTSRHGDFYDFEDDGGVARTAIAKVSK